MLFHLDLRACVLAHSSFDDSDGWYDAHALPTTARRQILVAAREFAQT